MIIDLDGKIDAFLIRLASQTSLDAAWIEVVRELSSFGMDGIVAILNGLDGGGSPLILGRRVEAVQTLCASPDGRAKDGVLRHMATALHPRLLDLDGGQARDDLDGAAEAAQDPAAPWDDSLTRAARADGYGGGLAVPVRCGGGAGSAGMIVLTRQSGPSFRAFAAEHGLTLACVAMQSHLKLWELAHQQGNTSGNPLTRREREVLTLSARGLTTREVGDSLGISVSGVNFHIANAARKLSANNRTHATSLAISAGYITP